MKFQKIILLILLILFSNKIFSNTDDYEFTMECLNIENKFIKYVKFKNNICLINLVNQRECKEISSSDDSNLTFVTEFQNKIEIIDFKKKKITSAKDKDFKEFSCQNFVEKKNRIEMKEIDYGVKNLSNKNENINLKNAKEVFLKKKNEFEVSFYDSLFVWDFVYFKNNISKIENLRKEITVIKNKGNFIDAIKKVDEAEIEIKKTNKKLDKDFNKFFINAKSHYNNLSYLKAEENIQKALKLKPNFAGAKKLRTKISELPKKIQILKSLDTARSENNKKKELVLMEMLSQIDKNPKLDKEIKNLSMRLVKLEFEKNMNKAEKFIKDGDIKKAENSLIKAKKILPNRPEITLFESKLDKHKEEKIKNDLLTNFNIASKNDDWKSSLLSLKKIEAIEKNDAFIREKIEMTEEILSLKKSLKDHSKNLHRLINQKFKNVVLNDLKSSEKYLDISPSLTKHYLEVSEVIKKSEKKVSVKIISDNETFIEIRGIGKVGKVEEKIIQLPPGEYYFVGKKEGFKDVFLDINLTKKKNIRLKIICLEQI